MGASCGLEPGSPTPSMFGWLIPSRKPKVVRPVGSCRNLLLPDHLDTGRVLVGDAGPLQFLVQLRRIGGESTRCAI